LHPFALPERGFNLSQLDAVTANLDLIIHPPQKLEAAVLKLNRKITALVQPAFPIQAEGIGQKSSAA
jgi:hypothetical protein